MQVLVRLRRPRLATQLFLLQVMIVGLVGVASTEFALVDAQRDAQEGARQRALDVAQTFAGSPTVAAALQDPVPTVRLQPLAESVRRATGVDFVVVMNTHRVRYSHPNPAQIGRLFIGHVEPALRGRPFTETYTGTLGPSIRAVVPVFGPDGRVVGMVSTGITTTRVSEQLHQRTPAIIGVGSLGFGVAALGTLLVSRRLRRQTLGLDPAEITSMYEHHDAVLHAVREGVLVLDRDRRLLLANDEAVRLLDLPPGTTGSAVADLELPPPLRELLVSGRPGTDEIHLTDERVLVVSQQPATRDGRVLGTVTTLRDHTELSALSGELDSVRGFAEALRAHAHEAANRLHTVTALVELGRTDEAVRFATAGLAAAQELTDRLLVAVSEPALAALLLGKAAQAAERGVDLVITEDTASTCTVIEPRDLVTIVGNLVDNAIDAALAAPPPRRVTVSVREDAGVLLVRVADTGAGLDPARFGEVFTHGWSTKPVERLFGRGLGLGLVRQAVHRHGGDIEVTSADGAVFTVRLPIPALGSAEEVDAWSARSSSRTTR